MGKGWAVLSLPYLQTIWMICIHSMCLTAMETQPAMQKQQVYIELVEEN